MKIATRYLAVLSFILLVLVVVPGAGLQAQTTAVGLQDTIYRLTSASQFQEGCFGPCACPVQFTDPAAGTFRLKPGVPDALFMVYEIVEVNWYVPGRGLRVTGHGTYRVGGEFALMHQLSLDLHVDGREVQHYDSGLILGGGSFPAIDLVVSVNGMVCHDSVFRVAALPVPPNELTPYALYGSNYLEGCFGPCDCAVRARTLAGRFGLLKLGDLSGETEYAVLNVRWLVRGSYVAVTGAGILRELTATRQEEMILDLIEGGSGPTRFDSGIVAGDGDPRHIDLDLAANGFACYDRVYSLHARPHKSANAGATLQRAHPEPVNPGISPTP
jgi:hypothetical protein